MKKKPATNPVVIKSLGKYSGNIDTAKLRAVIREIRASSPLEKKSGPLRIEDTASGSGHIGFAFGESKAHGKTKSSRKRSVG
ncbi:hypothetical protein [Arenimonas sp.]|uniref:hypothetical protein n=1 Tax=Arenimonas sp. TaxID=1872635 RepID=UPI002D1FAEF7|nr:hypothetical protein [Arenimonas sp.]